ncbi:hypothetical protein GALMADRAFT_87819 [Galerina marginata CBS 339.88]|uniref:Cutinase n=1 Tax=Galerina marginata (strain CBS 339.88) TaxID=685588 RepID=A0A067TRG1_GALM3|nr:hypothetical protein GALMADRAFT_87819 [Galerina marginata CBS 339.88]
MFSKAFPAFVLAASFLSVGAIPTPAPVSPCAAVHIIAARGSTEAPGAGSIGAIVTEVQTKSTQTVSTSAVDYPATLTNYASSSAQGTKATIALLTSQAQACPNQKIVLVGYSQGAHVVGDALAGGGGVSGLGAATPPIAASIASRVTAVVQLGDPRHIPAQPYDRGTSKNAGLFPRQPNQQYSAILQPRIQSFCDNGDPFCDSGSNLQVHLTYLDRYQDTASQFILQQIGG